MTVGDNELEVSLTDPDENEEEAGIAIGSSVFSGSEGKHCWTIRVKYGQFDSDDDEDHDQSKEGFCVGIIEESSEHDFDVDCDVYDQDCDYVLLCGDGEGRYMLDGESDGEDAEWALEDCCCVEVILDLGQGTVTFREERGGSILFQIDHDIRGRCWRPFVRLGTEGDEAHLLHVRLPEDGGAMSTATTQFEWGCYQRSLQVESDAMTVHKYTENCGDYHTILADRGIGIGAMSWAIHVSAFIGNMQIGIVEGDVGLTTSILSAGKYCCLGSDGSCSQSAGSSDRTGDCSYGSGDTIRISLDAAAGTVEFFKNGEKVSTATGLESTVWFPAVCMDYTGEKVTLVLDDPPEQSGPGTSGGSQAGAVLGAGGSAGNDRMYRYEDGDGLLRSQHAPWLLLRGVALSCLGTRLQRGAEESQKASFLTAVSELIMAMVRRTSTHELFPRTTGSDIATTAMTPFASASASAGASASVLKRGGLGAVSNEREWVLMDA
jgi:hypothetical protein